MDAIQAAVLGFIQGLTEFLPVSSSGHLVLFQNLFGLTEPELLFDICLHVGTLIAVCVVFWRDIWAVLAAFVSLPSLKKEAGSWSKLFAQNESIRLSCLIVVGSIPTVFLGLVFKEMVDFLFGSVAIVGVMLLTTGFVLWFTKNAKTTGRTLEQMSFKDVLIIGFVQGLAIIPGISRSGSTISMALYLGIDRRLAGRFSFLLSIPAICGALVLGLNDGLAHNDISLGVILLGSLIAAMSGYIALKILLRLVNKGRLAWFAPYCWLLGVVAIVWAVV
jgi:undecaprenyl-diphosphatase